MRKGLWQKDLGEKNVEKRFEMLAFLKCSQPESMYETELIKMCVCLLSVVIFFSRVVTP